VEGVPIQVSDGWIAEPATITLSVAGAEARLNELTADLYSASVLMVPTLESGDSVSVEATVPPLVEILSVTPSRVKLSRP
jgi:hypothetical protein